MPLLDVVVINRKKGTTTENQDADVKYIGYVVCVDNCVSVLSDMI